ncbi:hypothetical protein CANMA_003990 [Candida margitis]|uniref:uncharacterized protein n=1 Tax=Candida margitis TaxID=1775924 RepID=UPI002225DEFD|nr:uncharacterized protein CANMA_003990 [Candida margitis]KAI5960681.1 hypothetical protein CANMA_003990 [Candida margitis]
MGSSEDDETLKILASIRISKSIDDVQLKYLAQQGEKGYSERVIRDVLNTVFDLSRRSVSDPVKHTLVSYCLNPCCNMSIQSLLHVLANLGPTQSRVHGVEHAQSKKVPVALQVELLSQIATRIEFFATAIQTHSFIVLPILIKLMAYEFLRDHVSSLVIFIFLHNNSPELITFKNRKQEDEFYFTTRWESNWIRGLKVKFPADSNLRRLIEVIEVTTSAKPLSSTLCTITGKGKTGILCLGTGEENVKRRKKNSDSKGSMTRDMMSSWVPIGTPSNHLEASQKNSFAIQLCTNKLNLTDVDNYLKITSFQNKDFLNHWIVNVLWHFRRFNKDNFSIGSINEFVLNLNHQKTWSQSFHRRIKFIRLVQANVDELRSMIINDQVNLEANYSQKGNPYYSHLSEEYLKEILLLLEVSMSRNPEILTEISPLLLQLTTQFSPWIGGTVVRKILLLYRKQREADISLSTSIAVPRCVVYFSLLHGDLNVLDEICFHVAEEKKLHYTSDKLRRMQNSLTMDFVNMVWRGKFLSFNRRQDSPHKALFLNPFLLPKLAHNTCISSSELDDIGGILMSPTFVFTATKILRHLEDQHNLDVRIEGPLTEENVTSMRADERTEWLPLTREQIKLEILKVLDSRGFTGICDMMFKSLKSLSGARGN